MYNVISISKLFRPIEDDERKVVVVVPDINERVTKRAMNVITNKLGYNEDNLAYYKGGMEKWLEVHEGSDEFLEYTKYIRFEALKD